MNNDAKPKDAKPEDRMDELKALHGLRVSAPANSFARFRRRAGVMQGGKLLLTSQVTGFWLVLDALLRRIFRVVPLAKDNATQNSGENA